MIPLAPKRKPRHNETRDLTRPIEAALNHLDGVRVTRNNNLGPVVPYAKKDIPGIRPVPAGLGTGSADLVGIVTMLVNGYRIGRVFCLEVKRPGQKPDPDQIRWLAEVRKLGGFACVVHSIEEATAAVDRCRRGESE